MEANAVRSYRLDDGFGDQWLPIVNSGSRGTVDTMLKTKTSKLACVRFASVDGGKLDPSCVSDVRRQGFPDYHTISQRTSTGIGTSEGAMLTTCRS